MRASPVLDMILAPGGLSAVFQPVVEVRGPVRRVHCLESLIRGPRGTNMEPAPVLFEYVRRTRKEDVVDRACVTTTLQAARRLPATLPVSFNVDAATLERDPEFVGFLADAATSSGIAVSRLTVEIVGRAQPWDIRAIREATDALRHIGVGIALDDVGLGDFGVPLMLECRPDYLKVDGYLVRGCRSHHYRRAVLESLVGLAWRVGARLVAEGVEEEGDFAALASLGIALFQGNFLCPALAPDRVEEVHRWATPA